MTEFLANVLDATVRQGTPLLLAALGELISERGGVLNLGVEGMMLVGALTGFVGAWMTGSPWLGLAIGITAGAVMASIHAVLCITLKSDQVISGVMLTLLGTGLTTFFGQGWVQRQIDGFSIVTIPVVGETLADLPVVGPALFENTAPVYLAIVAVPAVSYLLLRSNVGLELTAVGDDPEAADTMGVSVFRMRYLAVIVGGAFAGAGGAYLSLASPGIWATEITAGRGWIAVALVIFAGWRPWRALVGAYLFGGINTLGIRSQGLDLTVGAGAPLADVINPALATLTNPQVMAMYPYLATLIVLVLVTERSLENRVGAPSALLKNYSRELD